MAKSADHRRHLNHPVIASFLSLKWSRISFLYNINIAFVFLMVAILTSYIFANYAGPSLDVTSPLCFADLNATERLSEGISRSPHGNDVTLRILLIVLLAVPMGRELIQFLVAPIKHLKSFENILEILLIVLLRYGVPTLPSPTLTKYPALSSSSLICPALCFSTGTLAATSSRKESCRQR